jgi:putative SOS response-associated peptidase YedK
MCGRYVRTGSQRRYAQALGLPTADDPQKHQGDVLGTWNMAPSQCSVVYRNEPRGREFASLYWGLLPFWSLEAKGLQPINAQSERAHEKPMFRKLVRHRRCLVAADGFYECVKPRAGKVPHYITRAGGEPIFFAGLGLLARGSGGCAANVHHPHHDAERARRRPAHAYAGHRATGALRPVDGRCCARSCNADAGL